MAVTRDNFSDTEDFFEMSLDHLCVAGIDGYFRRVSPSWTRTLGWTAAELKARPLVEFVHPEDRALTLRGRETLQMGSAMGALRNRYRCKDGSYRWFEWRSVAHLDRGLVYAAARDITEQKLAEVRLAEADLREQKLQRQLMFADRMASVGVLAGGVAHEINNPLASLMGNIAMIIEELDRAPNPNSELREMGVDIQSAAERIRKIVRGLTSFSRAEVECRGVIDLRPVLDLATDMTSNQIQGRARLVKDYGDTPQVDADEARLGQVFINLLVNAAQALPEGHRDTNQIRIATTTDPEGRAVVEVHDTGSGISKSAMVRIFDPFFTTKDVGVGIGLGLSICHTLVTGMGGEISAASEPGHGATFRVVLPAASPTPRDA
jgi:PAS domain S-box-containing protein